MDDLIIYGVGTAIVVFCFGFSFVGGFVAQIFYAKLRDTALERRLLSFEDDLLSLHNSVKGQKSAVAKAERDEEVQLAMAEAAKIMQEGGEDKMKNLTALAVKYPSAAKYLMKNLGLKGLFG